MAAGSDHVVTVFAEPAFSAAVSFGVFVCTAFAFGLHQGIPTAVTGCVILMIRNFGRSRPTFMMRGRRRGAC
jgi:hypothetical protein